MTATATLTRTAPTKAIAAVNMALAAGFEVTSHGIDRRIGCYMHMLAHADGRLLCIRTGIGDQAGRFLVAHAYNYCFWNTRTLTARGIPALARLLAAGRTAA